MRLGLWAAMGATAIASVLAGCGDRSAVVRVCVAASGADSGSPTAARCRCMDDIARKQLGPERYSLLDAAARAAEREGARSATAGVVASTGVLGRALVRAHPTERIIAVGDAALIAGKVASRCP